MTKGTEQFVVGVALAGFAGGTFCTGLAMSALHLNPVNIDITPSGELIASLLGALVGGAISIAATSWFNFSERRRREKSLAYSLMSQVAGMHSDLYNIKDYIDRSLEGRTVAPELVWTVVVPNAGTYSERMLDEGGMAILIEGREWKTHGDLIEMQMDHATATQAWNDYCSQRRELKKFMPISGPAAGNKFSSVLDHEKNPEAILRITELDTLITSLILGMPGRITRSNQTVAGLNKANKRYFRDKKFPAIDISIRRESS